MKRIKSKKELEFYLMADRMMNQGCFKPSLFRRLIDVINPDYMMRFLELMRKYSYYKNCDGIIAKFKSVIYQLRYKSLSLKLGYTIDPDAFGYGLSIPHYGTIVVGSPSTIGNYAVIQTGVTISGNGKVIGDALYMATGAKITTKMVLGDNITIAANSVCVKPIGGGNMLLAGMPAIKKADAEAWYLRDGHTYSNRVKLIEDLKKKMGIS